MPSIIHLPHYQQEFDYSCVAACARMILAAGGRELPEKELRLLLKTRPSTGTHPINLLNLESLGVTVVWPHPATLGDVQQFLEQSIPVIVFVWTGSLHYWPPTEGVDYLHTVVVIGVTPNGVLLHDPKLPNGPVEVSLHMFSEAWQLADHYIAVIH